MSRFPNFRFGSFGDDVLDGTPDRDLILGLFGDDTITAGAGRDTVFAGWGDDLVRGGDGGDRLFGGLGDDSLEGGAGRDRLSGGHGIDTAIYRGAVQDFEIVQRSGDRAVVRDRDEAGDVDRLDGIERLYFAADDYTVDLTGGNNAVLARDDAAALSADGSLVLDGLTANDFDFDGDTLTITALDTGDLAGTATLNADGTITYDAAGAFDDLAEGETAETVLRYTVGDGRGSTDTATVTLTVTGVDAGPTMPALGINEFHYDNAGADTGEFIEVSGAGGASIEGWTLVLYNGNGGTVYDTLTLSGSLSEDGFASVDVPGLQNGGPDGIALVNPDGEVVEFIAYEGELTATDGPAAGLTAADIGVAEGSDTAIGQSLQKQADGTWAGPATATRDAANDGGDGGGPGGESEARKISEVQGSGASSTLVDRFVNVTAVVTATVANGFYLQEEDADADGDAATSEGIFVFTGDTAPDVTLGEVVFAEGIVSENFGFTQIEASDFRSLGTADLPTAAGLTLPFEMSVDLEAVEGMRVSVDAEGAPLTVIENFNFDRFGQITVSAGEQIQPTQIFDAQEQADEVAELAARNAANRLSIDDGLTTQNPDSFGYIANDTPGDDGDGVLSAGDDFALGNPAPRLGAELTAPIEGVLNFAFGEYNVIPTGTLAIDPATNDGARAAEAPEVGGDLKVVSFNALNYFTTLGERGAASAADLERQTEKLVNALVELDGDVVGLQEIENNGFGAASAIATLVDALNDRLGSEVYGFVDPTADGGPIGTDAITTGLIYKLDAVSVTGSGVLEFDDGGEQRNRPAIAAAFEDAEGGVATIAVNHFKSKGPSGLDGEDPATNPNVDQGDGQGFWNAVRTDAATQLTEWLAGDPFGTGDPDYLIIGDLNAYNEEDPVQAIEAAGYANLLEQFVGAEDAFSFVFDGQRGALDHALATESLAGQVTGVAEWHVNSPEADLLSYSSQFTDPGFYNGSDPFAASDHDPLIVGLDLTGPDDLLA